MVVHRKYDSKLKEWRIWEVRWVRNSETDEVVELHNEKRLTKCQVEQAQFDILTETEKICEEEMDKKSKEIT